MKRLVDAVKEHNISTGIFKPTVYIKEKTTTKASDVPDSETLITDSNDIINIKE